MLYRTFMVACLFVALSACERSEPVGTALSAQPEPPPSSGHKTISAMPEHFDRVRAEQFEKEEDRVRRRGRAN